MLQYFQFPKFLLKLRISQTAKFLYMVLYDRARISRKNSWIDKYGNVYLIFPIDELSVQIDKCKSSVKTALKELDDEGLLVRRSGGFSKPNHLYVKIPSDEIGLQPFLRPDEGCFSDSVVTIFSTALSSTGCKPISSDGIFTYK